MKEEGWPITTDLDESPQEVVLVFKFGHDYYYLDEDGESYVTTQVVGR